MLLIIIGSILGGAVIGCGALLFYQKKNPKPLPKPIVIVEPYKRTKRFLVIFETDEGGQARRVFETAKFLRGSAEFIDGEDIRGRSK